MEQLVFANEYARGATGGIRGVSSSSSSKAGSSLRLEKEERGVCYDSRLPASILGSSLRLASRSSLTPHTLSVSYDGFGIRTSDG